MTEPIPTALILSQLLINEGYGSEGPSSPWPVFVGFMPEDSDNAVGLYDTAGTFNGRLMTTGEIIIHPGFQIQSRSVDYSSALEKIQSIALFLDTVFEESVTIDANTYIIQSVSRQGDILNMGMSDPDRMRQYFSMNALATLRKNP